MGDSFSAIAFITYDKSAEIDQTTPADPVKATNVPGSVLNGDNFDGYDDSVSIIDLKSKFYFKHNQKKADKTFYMQYTEDGAPGFNDVSFRIDTFDKKGRPFLSDGDNLDPNEFCHNAGRPNGADMGPQTDTCYNIIDINIHDIVDFFIINPDTTIHMLHMHGYHYRVLAEGNFGPHQKISNYAKYLQKLDASHSITRNFDYPVKKDTLQARNNGWQLIRIHANNPGYWITHCHIAIHQIEGMNFVIKVGNRTDWNIPNSGSFPTCEPKDTCTGHGCSNSFIPCP